MKNCNQSSGNVGSFGLSGFILGMMAVFCLGLGIDTLQAAETLPSWTLGSWWKFTSIVDMDITIEAQGISASFDIADDNTQYSLVSTEQKTLSHGTMATYEVYRLTYSASASGSGTVTYYTLEIPAEIRNATITGEWWVDTATLGTVYFSRHLEGELWADMPSAAWSQVGTAVLDMNEEYEPPEDLMNFPLDVGDEWTQDVSFFIYGHYIFDVDIGMGPMYQEDDFDMEQSFNFAMSVPNQEMFQDMMTYVIIGDEASTDTMLLGNYAPEAQTLAYHEIKNYDSGQGIVLNSMSRRIDDYYLAPASTPTPIPTPTATPTPAMSGIDLQLSHEMFHTGDNFICTANLYNTGTEIVVTEFIALDVYGQFWFWPDWTEDVTFKVRTLEAGAAITGESVIEFEWPQVQGSARNLKFWAALVDPEGNIFGSYDMVEWGYE